MFFIIPVRWLRAKPVGVVSLIACTIIMLGAGWWQVALLLDCLVIVSWYVVHLRRQRRRDARRASSVRSERSDPVEWAKAQRLAASPPPPPRTVMIRPLAEARLAAQAIPGSIVVDIPSPRGASTLLASPHADTMLHLGTGGGVGAASDSPSVAPLATALLTTAASQSDLFVVAVGSFAAPGAVRLVFSGPSGPVAADVSSTAFNGSEPHPLAPTLAAARRVVAQLQATPDQRW